GGSVLRMLTPYREGEVHMRASWICTRADVMANFGLLVSGFVVLATGWRYPDLAVGIAIGIYVAKEAIEIWHQARDPAKARLSLLNGDRALFSLSLRVCSKLGG
ncbi:hypothetical protein PQR16_36845, partial [Caballeronia glebae]